MHKNFDIVILGAGAAGLMCAIEAARRGRSVIILDHAAKPAEKIRISGGGRCNFTHLKAGPKNFISQNPHFAKSALKRFGPYDFLDRVIAYNIPYFEKTEGQLFCHNGAQDIIDMLLNDLEKAGGELWLNTHITAVDFVDQSFVLKTSIGELHAEKLVMATGGLSIPKMGATGFSYDIARQFGHTIIETRAGLVPFTLGPDKLARIEGLSGVSLDAQIGYGKTQFNDGFLFTHRGLSGPCCLQISNYWRMGQPLLINLRPDLDTTLLLNSKRKTNPKQILSTFVNDLLPKRLAERLMIWYDLPSDIRLADMTKLQMTTLHDAVHRWALTPDGTEGYRTAEVTIGGVDTLELSSQTMESQLQAGLYFIGECVDVTGWLGGYNFQWAWSSGFVCGQSV